MPLQIAFSSGHQPVSAPAILASTLTITGQSTFQETGELTTSHGTLSFTTLGSGYFTDMDPDEGRTGVALGRIIHGAGAFTGPTGVIASLFTLCPCKPFEQLLLIVLLPSIAGV
jgi:hypothetical protein